MHTLIHYNADISYVNTMTKGKNIFRDSDCDGFWYPLAAFAFFHDAERSF